jgi:hypothetical protein
MNREYKFAVFATQGGGLARRVGKTLIFVEAPPDGMGLGVGDEVPERWDCQPVNELARQDMENHPQGFSDADVPVTGKLDYKELFKLAIGHLRAVSGSRNSFTREAQDALYDKARKGMVPLRTPEVERMHRNAYEFLKVYEL